jgi:hypothetical protein
MMWSTLLAAVAAGCGGNENYPTPSTTDGGLPPRVQPDSAVDHMGDARSDGATGDGGEAGTGDGGDGDGGGDGGGDGVARRVSVQVEIDSPTKPSTPDGGAAQYAVMVAANRFTPEIRVTIDSTGATDPDTITEVLVTVTKVGAKMAAASAKLGETKLEQVPETDIAIHRFTDTPVDISKLESGVYDLEATASTIGGVMAKAKTTFQIDAGPVIRIDSPGENKYYRESTTLNVTITDAFFGPIKSVTMLLGQQTLTFSGPSGPSNSQYSGTIQFNAFNPPLEGDQLLTVRATNQKGTEAVARRKFVSDNKGPTITETVPKTGALIGRVITISAQVDDPAGVLDSSVVAVIAHGDKMFEVKLEPPAAGSMGPVTYTALFDTARLPVNALFPSISFRASDIPGNQSSVGYLVSLDNTPPLADLDPPTKLKLIRTVNDVDECSWPFDPLGDDAVNDLETVNQLFDVRARIEDQGNSPLYGDTDFTPIGGIDDTRVQLLVLDDTTKALVVDTDGDGKCDAVNPLLTPTTTPMSDNDALLVNLLPIAPAGDANFYDPNQVNGVPGLCAAGSATKAPGPLCGTTPLTTALHYASTVQAATYGIPPVTNDKLQCVGRQFDALGNHVKDGWICLAVAVADTLGNLQVSRPIRVCVDKDGQGDECAVDAQGVYKTPAPDCTGTETATKPDVVVDTTKPCTAWASYPATEYRKSR